MRPVRAASTVRRAPDQRDDLVERVERLEQTAQDVDALLGLAQPVCRAPLDDLDLVLDPVPDERVDRQRARHPVDQGEHVRAEVRLQLGVLVEVVEHDLGDGVALEHDDEALTGAARGLVADVGDAGQAPVLDVLGDLLREAVGVDLVGQLGDDQALPALDLLDLHDRAHDDRAAARAVGVLDAAGAHDERAGGEVGALDLGMTAARVSSRVASGWASTHSAAAATSRRLCGGMFVAMPTAMPELPLTSRFGKRLGSTTGSRVLPS
jgi:hypothetical protein